MEIFGFDAFSPKEVAGRVNDFCVVKARLPLLTLWMLGMLAGAFIGLGALYFTLVVSDASLGFAAARVAGGVCFSLGLLLVVVAGAELFTGNNLLAMGWADGCVSLREVLRNWVVVCAANFVGAAGLALLVYLSGHWEMNGGAVGATYLKIAAAKAALPVVARVLPRRAVQHPGVHGGVDGAGRAQRRGQVRRHPAADLGVRRRRLRALDRQHVLLPAGAAAEVARPGAAARRRRHHRGRHAGQPGPVIAGNIVGGSVLVALVYWVIYLRGRPPGGEAPRS